MSSLWTPKPHFCGGRAYYKPFLMSTCGLLCALLLASCGPSTPAGYPGSPESSVSSPTLEPLTAPPNPDNRPPAPGMTGAPKTPDGLPALQAKGMNTNLFSQKMSGEVDRIDRLERAVQELRNDFDTMSPAIVRLVAIEGDIQGLIKQLEVLTGNPPPRPLGMTESVPPIEETALEDQSTDGAAETMEAANAPQNIMPPVPEAPQPLVPEQAVPAQEAAIPVAPAAPAAAQAPAALAASEGVAIMDIRVGEHPDKTRIVLDVRGKATFTTDLDNQEHILVIEVPDAGWNVKTQQSFDSSPMVSSYRVQKSGDHGTMVVVQLKKAAAISYKGTIDNDTKTGQKLVIDIAAAK